MTVTAQVVRCDNGEICARWDEFKGFGSSARNAVEDLQDRLDRIHGMGAFAVAWNDPTPYTLPEGAYAELHRAARRGRNAELTASQQHDRWNRPVTQVRWRYGQNHEWGGVICTVPRDEGLAALDEARRVFEEIKCR